MPVLSVLLIIGEIRDRGQIVLDSLNAQTAAGSLEIVLIDLAADRYPRLRIPAGGVPVYYLERSPSEPWGELRALAARQANCALVAFAEDHAIPSPTWAEAIIRASSRPWVAAGYTFVNANPGNGFSWKTYASWTGFITSYGEWACPFPPGPVRRLACNGLAYRRQALLDLGDNLGGLLHSDANIQEYFLARGLVLEVIPDAVVAHENYEELTSFFGSNFAHCRVLAASRVQLGGWGLARRICYAVSVPFAVPFMKVGRLLRPQFRRRALWAVTLAALPVSVGVFVWSSVGESFGYLFGIGNSLRRFQQAETSVPRSAHMNSEA